MKTYPTLFYGIIVEQSGCGPTQNQLLVSTWVVPSKVCGVGFAVKLLSYARVLHKNKIKILFYFVQCANVPEVFYLLPGILK